ncbi:4-(cytidine 5'-diphospho)-2-C-methyl-D-erythritol kinase [Sandaracinobacteroides saxicola]|uniref:4-(cytidine 5'-diphospho)-2-C-methyl-D-erythritol kinase n=1 Tax=Sandaracinobacteroides saxicola TaxID=2759707 RepID=UPI001FB19C8B|nr:4-(cytidine 5'-diphospho)-2-C-methyl-D-erythritol kinase [Sandaracinobacteroides saxicola]
MIETAWAKLNLALHVRRRETDGYHALETLFAFTEFGDTLAVAESEALTLCVSGEFAGAAGDGEENLVLRAARALESGRGAALRLEKRIPVAAGLGGGSADAAAALRLLNRHWGLGRSVAELEAIGATLGADVAACVRGVTVRGEGRGEVLTPVSAVTGVPVLLVNPRVAVATGPVFRAWDGVDRGALPAGETLAVAKAARNDLEGPAVGMAPAIAEVLAWLRGLAGVQLARMSGSGATCFALFGDEGAAVRAGAGVPGGWWGCVTRLRP